VTEIRPARIEDAAALAVLTSELGHPVAAEAMRQRLDAVLGAPHDGALLVSCTDEDVPVGWIHVGERTLLEADRYCEIMGLVVDAAYRRQGRAGRLVAAAERWAIERGHRQLRVSSNILRAESHPFYERAGYRRIKTQHVYSRVLETRGW
jgi:GNAT superfamily N-acetyltransferase